MADEKHLARAERILSEGETLDPEVEAREAIARSWKHGGECARLALMTAQAWATLAVARELRLARISGLSERPGHDGAK